MLQAQNRCQIRKTLVVDFQRTAPDAGPATRPSSATEPASMIASSTDMSTVAAPESTGVVEEAAAPSPTASDSGSSVSTSGGSPSAFAGDIASAPEDAVIGAAGNQFMNWSYKNVELLGERNREMAEQFAELRNEFGGRKKNEEHRE